MIDSSRKVSVNFYHVYGDGGMQARMIELAVAALACGEGGFLCRSPMAGHSA